jgi:hypothetical protein
VLGVKSINGIQTVSSENRIYNGNKDIKKAMKKNLFIKDHTLPQKKEHY